MADLGATKYIACNKSSLSSLERSNEGIPVIIPNGDCVSVEGIGTTYLPNDTQVDHVLYILDFKCNLLSFSKITK